MVYRYMQIRVFVNNYCCLIALYLVNFADTMSTGFFIDYYMQRRQLYCGIGIAKIYVSSSLVTNP